MRFITTRVHGLLDFAFGMLLLSSPWVFQFDHGSAETWLPLLLANGALAYTLFTDHEWAVSRTIPMTVHLLLDISAGILLAVSPWLFGFAHSVWIPHVALGAGEVLVALLTKTKPTSVSYPGVKRIPVLILFTFISGCRTDDDGTYTITTMAGQRLVITSLARPLTQIGGLREPESVLYDAEQDVFFISNMEGFGSAKDNRGYILRVPASDYSKAHLFAVAGTNGVTLHAPKGMALRDSVLWVTDIDVMRGFHRRTGAPAGIVDMRPHGAILLNDVATGPNGELYVTDSAILMTDAGTIYQNGDRIFSISAGGTVSVVEEGEKLKTPNGIKWDSAGKRWVVAGFDPFDSIVYELRSDQGVEPKILARGHGNFDGLEILKDGSILVSSWDDYSIHMITPDGMQRRIASNLHRPADFGIDTKRNLLLIPSVILGRVEIWQLDDSRSPGS